MGWYDGPFYMGKVTLAAAIESMFTRELARVAQETELLLDALLPEVPDNRLRSAMRYATLGGGKRLRPFLVVQSAALFDVSPQHALSAGAALECLHCYSLVHDDLPAMDNDSIRRGRATVHRHFDEATAILAGDSLLTFAFEVLCREATHPKESVRLQLVLELSRAAGESGMAGGQMLDLMAESEPFRTLAAISDMQNRKTGALIRFASEAGAMLAEADRGPLARYGAAIGLAFQISDDVLDVEADPSRLGKATQKDEAKGKATFVEFLGLEGAKREAHRLVEQAIAALAVFGQKADMLRETAGFIVSRRS
jgi:farnesyl diphosphate synthase